MANRAPLSVVFMTWNRNGQRLRNILASLCIYQSLKPLEVITVDTSIESDIAKRNRETAAEFPDVKYIARPSETFNKCWALNVGIKATSPKAEFIMCTDVDEMFSYTYIETALQFLRRQDNVFLLSEVGFLGQTADIKEPFSDGNWDRLCANVIKRGWASGTIQAAKREWWFKVHGYDERFSGGLGHMDSDLGNRARKGGLTPLCIPFKRAQALHQWHRRSPLKLKTRKFYSGANPVVANPNGWGE